MRGVVSDGYNSPMTYPSLWFPFHLPVRIVWSVSPDLVRREAAVRAALASFGGAVTTRVLPVGWNGPDRDTQFLTLELGWFLVEWTSAAGTAWSVRAAEVERRVPEVGSPGPWGVSTRGAGARVSEATDWGALLAVHDALAAAFRALGFVETSFTASALHDTYLREPLARAGAVLELASLAERRAVALLAPDLELDGDNRTFPLADCGDLDVAYLLAHVPAPARFTGIDLRRNALTAIPSGVGRFTEARHLDLGENGLVHVDLAALRAIPALQSVSLRDNPLAPGTLEALRGAGLRVDA